MCGALPARQGLSAWAWRGSPTRATRQSGSDCIYSVAHLFHTLVCFCRGFELKEGMPGFTMPRLCRPRGGSRSRSSPAAHRSLGHSQPVGGSLCVIASWPVREDLTHCVLTAAWRAGSFPPLFDSWLSDPACARSSSCSSQPVYIAAHVHAHVARPFIALNLSQLADIFGSRVESVACWLRVC